MLGSELCEDHFASLVEYVVNFCEMWKFGDYSFQFQSSAGDVMGIEGCSGGVMCQGGEPDTSEFHI